MPVIERPNILLCLFDALSTEQSGLFAPDSNLPVLSQLRETSACFTRLYTPNPESSPARASLLTGLDPCVHGLWTNGVTLPSHELTLPQRLTQAGYASYIAGRYQLSGVSRWTTEQFRSGEFAQTDWAHGPLHRSRQNGYLQWLQETAGEQYRALFPTQADPDNTELNSQQRAVLADLPDELSFNHWVGRQVGQWIAAQQTDRAFLAIAGFVTGEKLGTEPDPHNDAECLDRPALQQADAAIGRLLAQIADSGRADDTVVIVAAARGNAEQASEPATLKECTIRVPLMIHGGGCTPQFVDAPLSTMDIAPTILDLSKLPIGARTQGRSLRAVLNGEELPRDWAMSRRRGYSPTGENNWQSALCSGAMKLVVHHSTQKSVSDSMAMYNLETDPHEQTNLAQLPSHAETLEQMIDQMIDARCALEDRTEPRIAEF